MGSYYVRRAAILHAQSRRSLERLTLQSGQVVLKVTVLLFSSRSMVDLFVAVGADRSYPPRMVRSAVRNLSRVVRFQVRGAVGPCKWSWVAARLAGCCRPCQYVLTYGCAPLVVEAFG